MPSTVVLEKTLENPLDCRKIKSVNSKGNQPWIFIGRTDAEAPNTLAIWCEELTLWKRPWCWERLKARGRGDNRGWDGWMASSTQWTWVWASYGRWWRTGKFSVLQSLRTQSQTRLSDRTLLNQTQTESWLEKNQIRSSVTRIKAKTGLGSSQFHVSVIHTSYVHCTSNKNTTQMQCDNLQMRYHPLKFSNKMTQ